LVDNALPHEPRIGDRFLTNYFLKCCDACLVMSKSVGQDIQQMKSDMPVGYSPHPLLAKNVKSINQYIPDDEVHLYFSATDLVAQTYHTATQSGISQIVMHYEKPVLVTDVGGLDEIVLHEKTGYVAKKDPVVIAKNIIDFFEIKNYDTYFEAAITKEKQKYSWEAFVDNLIELYYKI